MPPLCYNFLKMIPLRKARFLLVYLFIAWYLFVAQTTELSLRLGILFIIIGEAVRLWANGYVGHVKVNKTKQGEAKIGRLVTAGPYAYVRHPLYLGTFLIGAGFCVTAANAWLSLAAFGFFLFVYQRKMAEEESSLQHEWGETYRLYHETVPQWLPSVRRYPKRQGQWSRQGILASKESKTVTWIIVCLLMIYFREEFWQERQHFSSNWLKYGLLASLLVALITSDGILELIHRRRAHVRYAPSSS